MNSSSVSAGKELPTVMKNGVTMVIAIGWKSLTGSYDTLCVNGAIAICEIEE